MIGASHLAEEFCHHVERVQGGTGQSFSGLNRGLVSLYKTTADIHGRQYRIDFHVMCPGTLRNRVDTSFFNSCSDWGCDAGPSPK